MSDPPGNIGILASKWVSPWPQPLQSFLRQKMFKHIKMAGLGASSWRAAKGSGKVSLCFGRHLFHLYHWPEKYEAYRSALHALAGKVIAFGHNLVPLMPTRLALPARVPPLRRLLRICPWRLARRHSWVMPVNGYNRKTSTCAGCFHAHGALSMESRHSIFPRVSSNYRVD